MDKRSIAQINTLSCAATKADSAQPEEQIFVLDSSQLEQIVESAIVKATKPLLARIEAIETELEMRAYAHSAKVESLTLRIEALEIRKPQPKQRDRSEILRALIAAYGGKMPEKLARQKMHLSKQMFTNLLASIEDIEVRPLESDKRYNLLVLKD
jgi:hypothetical protein